MKEYLKPCFAEILGTFMLVFAGTGAIIINDISGGIIGHVGIALTFALVVLTVIYTYGDISGAHINPVVTLAFWATDNLKSSKALYYVTSQLIGALLASILLSSLFPTHATLGATVAKKYLWQALILEIIITWWLVTVILHVTFGPKQNKILAGMIISSVICLEAIFAGPISGASMNPARSIAPALISGQLDQLWLYILGPSVGAILAVANLKLFTTPSVQKPLTVKLENRREEISLKPLA